jgi:hypothetical protein
MQLILPYPFFVGQRISALDNGKLLLTVLVVSLVLMLLTLILWPCPGCKKTLRPQTGAAAISTIVSCSGAHCVLARHHLHCISPGTFDVRLGHLEVFSDKGTVWFHLVQVIGVLGAIGTLAATH